MVQWLFYVEQTQLLMSKCKADCDLAAVYLSPFFSLLLYSAFAVVIRMASCSRPPSVPSVLCLHTCCSFCLESPFPCPFCPPCLTLDAPVVRCGAACSTVFAWASRWSTCFPNLQSLLLSKCIFHYFEIICCCRSCSVDWKHNKARDNWDWPAVILECHSFSGSVCWIMFDNMSKKAVSKPMKGKKVEQFVAERELVKIQED